MNGDHERLLKKPDSGARTAGEPGLVPSTTLVQQFEAAPPGKLYCLHGSSGVFRLSLAAASHVLLRDIPVTLVDGTNRFDVYYIAEFARRVAQQQSGAAASAGMRGYGRGVDPEQLLKNIFISRAFTCYQMEATITERLHGFVRKKGSPIVIVFGLLDTFYDEQAPLFEVKASLLRIIAALNRLRQDNVSVLLASLDVKLASKERNSLFPQLMRAMDRVYRMEEEGGTPRIVCETRGRIGGDNEKRSGERRKHGTDSAHVYHGGAAGDGELVEVPARTAPGGPGSAR